VRALLRGPARARLSVYASARMVLTAAPGLPLVVGLPFLLLLGMCVVAFGIWFALGKLARR